MLYYISKFIVWAMLKVIARLKIRGREWVPRTGSVVLAANHTSYMDPPLVGMAAPRRIRYMARSSLFTIPLLGPMIRAYGAFPVKRGAVDRQALRQAHEILTSDQALLIFPEGTRSPDGRLLPPELGASMIALRAGVPIIPTAVINADHLLPREGKMLHFSRVTIVFGKPLTFPHLAEKSSDRAALREVSEAVMRAIAELMRTHGAADRVPDGYLDVRPEAAATE